jgi:hypothetical protein
MPPDGVFEGVSKRPFEADKGLFDISKWPIQANGHLMVLDKSPMKANRVLEHV